jgi:hypothetical protein
MKLLAIALTGQMIKTPQNHIQKLYIPHHCASFIQVLTKENIVCRVLIDRAQAPNKNANKLTAVVAQTG